MRRVLAVAVLVLGCQQPLTGGLTRRFAHGGEGGSLVGPGGGGVPGGGGSGGTWAISGGSGGIGGDGAWGGGGGEVVEIPTLLAADGNRLFRVESEPFGAVEIGPFVYPKGRLGHALSDIAASATGQLYGVSLSGELFEIDPATGILTELPKLDVTLLNSLAFVHANGKEILLGGTGAGELVRIHPGEKVVDRLGRIPYGFSGDLVEVTGVGILGTVRDDRSGGDLLVRVGLDATATELAKLPDTSVFGLASASGRLFGFAAGGTVLEIDPRSGRSREVVAASQGWSGATLAVIASQ